MKNQNRITSTSSTQPSSHPSHSHSCDGSQADQSSARAEPARELLQQGVLDVRLLPPARRHSLIFETYDSLRPGGSFVLVNDHDPKPLYYQFSYEKAGAFSWNYEEQGPLVWRVRIGKTDVQAALQSPGQKAH
jgi:uncharacterized protein (DUF2249 family)